MLLTDKDRVLNDNYTSVVCFIILVFVTLLVRYWKLLNEQGIDHACDKGADEDDDDQDEEKDEQCQNES